MANIWSRSLQSDAPASVILIRIVVGWIFFSEGLQKFFYPADLGAGRFTKIGLPSPELLGPFVGATELVLGLFILFGLFTRAATIPLLIIMFVALLSTKVPILLGQEFLGFSLAKLPRYGVLSALREARTDLCLTFGLLFLLIEGAGRFSFDANLARRLPR